MAKRIYVQWLSALLCNGNLTGFAEGRIYQGEMKAVCLPGLNCYSCPGALGACPIGSLQSALSGTSLRFPFYVLGLLMAFGLLFGRMICGWLCPFGLFQELLYKIPVPKIGKSVWTRRLRYLKYAVGLLMVLLAPLVLYFFTGIGEPVFCKYFCPAGTAEAAIPLLSMNASLSAAAGWLTTWKFFILAAFLLTMLLVYRPFCRFFCPLGAWYGLFNRQALLGIVVDKKKCVQCGKCAVVCPSDVKIAGDAECISCGSCREICPAGAISFRKLTCGGCRNVKK